MDVTAQGTQVNISEANEKWRSLYLLNFYRFALATIFLVVITIDAGRTIFGKHDPDLFLNASVIYLVFSVVNIFTTRFKRPSLWKQVYFQVVVDILLLVALMHASGSIQSGLGTLLIVSVAAVSVLSGKRNAIAIASLASIIILLEQTYIVFNDEKISLNFYQAGILGVALFATAYIAQYLAKRMQETEALATQRGVDLEKMELLADYIVQRMQTGVVVVDQNLDVRLMNDSAKHLLDLDTRDDHVNLAVLSPELVAQLQSAQQNKEQSSRLIRPTPKSAEVIPRFAELGIRGKSGTLIFLEDTSAISQQAQQLKLASLGRLTASIAHEIRNPLGAISHAAQLLAESEHLDKGEARMVQIIVDHSRRMNSIIENVLQLSRRQSSRPQELILDQWLNNFVSEFMQTNRLPSHFIRLETQSDQCVNFDPSQLQQILWNLCSNALRYTQPQSDGVGISLITSTLATSPIAVLDIVDYGPGIPDENINHVFEPFFTTDNKGTGLGLYIARELCESNQARLSYLKTADNLSCFRITFSDTRRLQA